MLIKILRNVLLVVAILVGTIIAILVGYTCSYMLIDWYEESKNSEELIKAFIHFHNKYAREPRVNNPTIAEQIHRLFMLKIERTFRRKGICHHLEWRQLGKSGAGDDVLFDVILVIDRYEYDLQVHHDNTNPGYAWLKINRDEPRSPEVDKVLSYYSNFFGYIFAGDLYINPDKTIQILINKFYNFIRSIFVGFLYVDPEKTSDIFYSELQDLINDSDYLKRRVKLSRNGQAIRMDVYPDSGLLSWGPRLYSAELAPSYQVDGTRYVSTPLKGEVPSRLTWRRSFSTYEKQNPSGGARHVLLALEAFRDREPDLEPLTSYHIKMALMYEMDAEYDWSNRAIVLRFLGVLGHLQTCLDNGILPLYLYPEFNLLSSVSAVSLRNMSDRIRHIRSNRDELMKILMS